VKKMAKIYDSKIPAYNTLMTALDILNNIPKLETLIENISCEEVEALYNHPLFNDENGHGNEIMDQLLP
jgi:hypothetical protein